jgi:hypothetical protein
MVGVAGVAGVLVRVRLISWSQTGFLSGLAGVGACGQTSGKRTNCPAAW